MDLLKPLLDTSQHPLKYIGKALLISLVPALVISTFFTLVFPWLEGPSFEDDIAQYPVILFLLLVLITPLLETLMMWPLINLISLLTKNIWVVALISAVIWGILHSLQALIWGLVIFWSFFVFSISFQVWRKVSRSAAVYITAGIHAGQNLFSFVALVLGS